MHENTHGYIRCCRHSEWQEIMLEMAIRAVNIRTLNAMPERLDFYLEGNTLIGGFQEWVDFYNIALALFLGNSFGGKIRVEAGNWLGHH